MNLVWCLLALSFWNSFCLLQSQAPGHLYLVFDFHADPWNPTKCKRCMFHQQKSLLVADLRIICQDQRAVAARLHHVFAPELALAKRQHLVAMPRLVRQALAQPQDDVARGAGRSQGKAEATAAGDVHGNRHVQAERRPLWWIIETWTHFYMLYGMDVFLASEWPVIPVLEASCILQVW